jgi:transcriptional regulator with PAS, ATPase and Fis domain
MHYISKRLNKREIILPDDFMNIMIDYNWPGNIRELENLIEMIINTEKIPLFLGKKNPQLLDIPDPEACTLHTLKEIEKNHILHVLQKNSIQYHEIS